MIEAGLKLKWRRRLGWQILPRLLLCRSLQSASESKPTFSAVTSGADGAGDASIAAVTASLRHLQRGTTAVLSFWQSGKKAGVANAFTNACVTSPTTSRRTVAASR